VVGRELERVQCGVDPSDWKPMASVGPGAREIRVHVGGEGRVVYVATFPDRRSSSTNRPLHSAHCV